MKGGRQRRRIVEAIQEQPGIHKSELARMLLMGWGTLGHHLGILQQQGKVRCHRTDHQVLLYPSEMPPEEARWLHLLRDDVCAAIVHQLAQEPELRLMELSRRVGVSRKVVRRQLDALDAIGLVYLEEEEARGYRLHEGALDLLEPGPRSEAPARATQE